MKHRVKVYDLSLREPHKIKTPTYRALCAVSRTMIILIRIICALINILWIPRIKRGT
jgi:hypothetical protein